MATEPMSFGARTARFFKRLILTVVVLGLAGASAYLMSMLNARTYALEIQNGQLVVMKGLMMPTGTEPWKPSDPVLVDTYAPLDLEGTSPMGVIGMKFKERDELDRALWTVIEGLARFRVNSDDPKQLERGLYYIRRGDRLTGLTNEQKLTLTQLKADVAFYTARARLEDAQRQTEEALVQLKLAAQAQNRHAREANQMLTAVEPEAKALSEALRKAVHTLSAPATPPEPEKKPEVKKPEPEKKPEGEKAEPVKQEGAVEEKPAKG
jgi:hypothetical protein